MSIVTDIRDWKPARQFLETYPGERPTSSYFLLNDRVYPMLSDHPLKLRYVNEDGESLPVDEVLKTLNLPPIRERYGLLS